MTTDHRGQRNWSGVADMYARTFAQLCSKTAPALLEHAELNRTHQVLDVGTGVGFLAGEMATSGANVTAVDPDPDMLRVCRAVVPASVDLVRAGLPHLPFAEGSHDVVMANFVINHVGDPRAGVRELARVTRAGGRLLLTIWPGRPTAQGDLFGSVMERSGAEQPTPDVLPPEDDFARSVEGLTSLVTDAGLVARIGEEIDLVWRIDPGLFWSGLEAGIGGAGKALLQQTVTVKQRMREVYDDLSRDLVTDGELVLPATAVLVAAEKPR